MARRRRTDRLIAAAMGDDEDPQGSSDADVEGQSSLITAEAGHDADGPMPFGLYLTRAREARGLSLDDLAHQTKIRRAILEALEHNAKRDLPEKVFVLGYVRSYAMAVGLNVDDACNRFNAAWGDDGPSEDAAEAKSEGYSFRWVAPTIASIIALVALWIVIRMR